jgi:hypothetical protein
MKPENSMRCARRAGTLRTLRRAKRKIDAKKRQEKPNLHNFPQVRLVGCNGGWYAMAGKASYFGKRPRKALTACVHGERLGQ